MGNTFSWGKHFWMTKLFNFILLPQVVTVMEQYLVNPGFTDAEWRDINITVKELYPIVLAVEVWGKRMANSCICFQCDNEALVYVNKHSRKESNIIFLIRKLVLLSLNFNILYKSEHIPGKKNVLSDALSHLQIQKFLHMIPEAEKVPTSVQLLPQLPN
jgi:hypothetical protein